LAEAFCELDAAILAELPPVALPEAVPLFREAWMAGAGAREFEEVVLGRVVSAARGHGPPGAVWESIARQAEHLLSDEREDGDQITLLDAATVCALLRGICTTLLDAFIRRAHGASPSGQRLLIAAAHGYVARALLPREVGG
jgi:hypothetical protein